MISLTVLHPKVEEGGLAWESGDLGFSLLLTLGKVIYNMREMTTSGVLEWGCTSESSEMFVENRFMSSVQHTLMHYLHEVMSRHLHFSKAS